MTLNKLIDILMSYKAMGAGEAPVFVEFYDGMDRQTDVNKVSITKYIIDEATEDQVEINYEINIS